MVLLDTVNSLKSKLSISIKVLHVLFNDFPEHSETIDLITEYCDLNELEYVVNYNKNICNNKEEARESIKQLSVDSNCDIVLTGHTKNDQIETILFRLFRGTGADGLVSMRKLSVIKLNNKKLVMGKPFLNIDKEELYKYAYINKVMYVEDCTNKNIDRKRNYIRNVIIPAIQVEFNTDKIASISNSIYETLKLVKENRSSISTDISEWKVDDLLNLSVGNRVYIVREYMRKHHGLVLNGKVIKELNDKFEGDLTNFKVDLLKGYYVFNDKGFIKIELKTQIN